MKADGTKEKFLVQVPRGLSALKAEGKGAGSQVARACGLHLDACQPGAFLPQGRGDQG